MCLEVDRYPSTMPNVTLFFKRYRALLFVLAIVFAAIPLLVVGEQVREKNVSYNSVQ